MKMGIFSNDIFHKSSCSATILSREPMTQRKKQSYPLKALIRGEFFGSVNQRRLIHRIMVILLLQDKEPNVSLGQK